MYNDNTQFYFLSFVSPFCASSLSPCKCFGDSTTMFTWFITAHCFSNPLRYDKHRQYILRAILCPFRPRLRPASAVFGCNITGFDHEKLYVTMLTILTTHHFTITARPWPLQHLQSILSAKLWLYVGLMTSRSFKGKPSRTCGRGGLWQYL